MAVTPTYPGIYIQELPSSTHTITAAPTSITVFVGYTHPFKTNNFNQAVELFSFTDYEREFGGLFASDIFDSSVAYAVNQFFLNGGSIAYVIGLQPLYHDSTGATLPPDPIAAPSVTIASSGMVFTAREPTDADHPITVTLNNLKNSPADTADLIIAYGTRVETFRSVTIAGPTTGTNYIDKRINGISQLVTVAPSGASYSTPIVAPPQINTPQALPAPLPANF